MTLLLLLKKFHLYMVYSIQFDPLLIFDSNIVFLLLDSLLLFCGNWSFIPLEKLNIAQKNNTREMQLLM
jgi:hypothetical protein